MCFGIWIVVVLFIVLLLVLYINLLENSEVVNEVDYFWYINCLWGEDFVGD